MRLRPCAGTDQFSLRRRQIEFRCVQRSNCFQNCEKKPKAFTPTVIGWLKKSRRHRVEKVSALSFHARTALLKFLDPPSLSPLSPCTSRRNKCCYISAIDCHSLACDNRLVRAFLRLPFVALTDLTTCLLPPTFSRRLVSS